MESRTQRRKDDAVLRRKILRCSKRPNERPTIIFRIIAILPFFHCPIRWWTTSTGNKGVAVVAVTTTDVATTRSIDRVVTTCVPLLSAAVTPVATGWKYTGTPVDAPPDPSAITVVADELLLRLLRVLLLLGLLLWPWHSAVHYGLLLLLLPGGWHISAAPPAKATWIANDLSMSVCVVLVGDAVVVAVAILTTAVASTFKPLWSGTDLSHCPSLPHRLHWYTLPTGELGGGGDSSSYHPVALEPQSNGPPIRHLGDA